MSEHLPKDPIFVINAKTTSDLKKNILAVSKILGYVSGVDYFLNDQSLENMKDRYDKDLAKLRKIHKIDADIYKIAGYRTWWLAKIKPISTTFKKDPKGGIRVNETIAVVYGMLEIIAYHQVEKTGIDKPVIWKRGHSEECKHWISDLTYLLRYRPSSPHNIAFLFQTLFQDFDRSDKLKDK